MIPFNQKKVVYKILPEYRLILEIYFGPIQITDVFELKKIQIEDKDYNANFNFIVFVDRAEMLMTESDYEEYVDAIKTNTKIVGERKTALLTRTPHQVVSMYFYEKAGRNLPISYNIFSTLDSALLWVGIHIDLVVGLRKEIERIVLTETPENLL